MEDSYRTRHGKSFAFVLVFSLVGALLLAAGLFLYARSLQFLDGATRVHAVIDDMDDQHTYVSYALCGILYENVPINLQSDSFHAGGDIELYIRPLEPQAPRASFTLYFPAALFGGLGIFFLLIGLGAWVSLRALDRRREELPCVGIRVETIVTRIEMNRKVAVNNRHPWNVACEATDGSAREFRSHNIWEKPSDALLGAKLAVYVDANRPRRYYVDVPEIRQST